MYKEPTNPEILKVESNEKKEKEKMKKLEEFQEKAESILRRVRIDNEKVSELEIEGLLEIINDIEKYRQIQEEEKGDLFKKIAMFLAEGTDIKYSVSKHEEEVALRIGLESKSYSGLSSSEVSGIIKHIFKDEKSQLKNSEYDPRIADRLTEIFKAYGSRRIGKMLLYVFKVALFHGQGSEQPIGAAQAIGKLLQIGMINKEDIKNILEGEKKYKTSGIDTYYLEKTITEWSNPI